MFALWSEGGAMMVVLWAGGLLALVLFLERLFHLHRAQIHPDDFLKGLFNLLKRGRVAEAVTICEDTPGPVAGIARAAILHWDAGSAERAKAVETTGLGELPRLEKRMGLLLLLGQLAPLAGFLGTVLGLLQWLAAMERYAPLAHAGDLAGGLRQALLTTAVGLALALPIYAGHGLLQARVASLVMDMEHAMREILTFLRQNSRPREESS